MIPLSPVTQQLLEAFAINIHWGAMGNPDDTDRFWAFVVSAYRNGEHTLSFDEFSAIIDEHTRPQAGADPVAFAKKRIPFLMFMFERYRDGIVLLKKFEEGR